MKNKRVRLLLTVVCAAAGLSLFAAAAGAAAVGEATEKSMDMSTWRAVLSALGVFLGGGFCTAVCAGLRAGRFSAVRGAFSMLLALLCAAAPALDGITQLRLRLKPYTAAAPAETSVYAQPGTDLAEDADFYVSPAGDDASDGSFAHPFRTPERAQEAVRALDRAGRSGITVALTAGEYRVSGLAFTGADSGTPECPVIWRAYGDGEVALNGGISLDPAGFVSVTDADTLSRLHGDAPGRVLCADLSALGLTPADYGKIYAIGSYNTAAAYAGDHTGPLYSELFVNDTRCVPARYPDEGFLYTGEVVSEGGAPAEGGPAGDTYLLDADLAARIAGWRTTDGVWMFGFWKYDWADASTPIGAFDAENRTLTTRFYSRYGAKENAPYYFFNVFEELDAPGEWYLDRETGVLYLNPPAGFGEGNVDLTLSTAPVIRGDGVHDLVFSGLTVKGTRGGGFELYGDRCTVSGCTVKNVAGTAMILAGTENLACDNEITRTGKGGIVLIGGDEATLTPGDNRAVNNLIHDWSEIYQTYQPAVALYGVGNVCEHNEMYNSPHEAITYSGNNHRIAYNRIHHVCLLSSDAGAIYAGRSWTAYGNEILYNCIYDLGSGDFTPCGIYMDDALSGQTIIGNLLVNIPGYALHLGGGRDLTVKNNIVVSGGQRGISYDQRALDGVYGGWFAEHSGPDGNMWTELRNSPRETEIWREAFPALAAVSDDFDRPDDPMFAPNPANSEVCGNLFVTPLRTVGEIGEKVLEFSTFDENGLFRPSQLNALFRDPANGDYTLAEDSPIRLIAPGFEDLPLAQMGRLTEADG